MAAAIDWRRPYTPVFIVGYRKLKYRLPSSHKRPGTFAWWLLVVGIAGIAVAVWWDSRHSASGPKPAPKPAVAARPVVPAAPPPRPVLPVEVMPPISSSFPRPVRNVFEAQLALVQRCISPGSLDGAIGSQTRAAITVFQQSQGLPITGQLDAATKAKLLLTNSPITTYTVTSNDLAHLQPLAPTWLGKSEQSALDYENILQLVSEKSFSHPDLIRQLNPGVNWSDVPEGTVLQVPDAAYPDPPAPAAFVVIHLSEKNLEAFDENSNLLVHFPCSIARLVEKRPVGELHVKVIAPHPNYTFDPAVFPESPEAQQLNRKLIIPAGPKNPVGVAWIGLDKEGYGIHGTPNPEQVGRTESHGCFRLANWNAAYLLRLVTIGTPVYVVE